MKLSLVAFLTILVVVVVSSAPSASKSDDDDDDDDSDDITDEDGTDEDDDVTDEDDDVTDEDDDDDDRRKKRDVNKNVVSASKKILKIRGMRAVRAARLRQWKTLTELQKVSGQKAFKISPKARMHFQTDVKRLN